MTESPDSAILFVSSGDRAGDRIRIGAAPLTIGRSRSCELAFPDDAMMSRRHWEIRLHQDRYVIRDLGSRHGTYLNNEPLRTAALHDGDMIRAGSTTVQFRRSTYDDDEAPDASVEVRVAELPRRVGALLRDAVRSGSDFSLIALRWGADAGSRVTGVRLDPDQVLEAARRSFPMGAFYARFGDAWIIGLPAVPYRRAQTIAAGATKRVDHWLAREQPGVEVRVVTAVLSSDEPEDVGTESHDQTMNASGVLFDLRSRVTRAAEAAGVVPIDGPLDSEMATTLDRETTALLKKYVDD